MTHVSVTTWSANKRHLVDPESPAVKSLWGEKYVITLCGAYPKRPGEVTAARELSQEQIDALPLCLRCKKKSHEEVR